MINVKCNIIQALTHKFNLLVRKKTFFCLYSLSISVDLSIHIESFHRLRRLGRDADDELVFVLEEQIRSIWIPLDLAQ